MLWLSVFMEHVSIIVTLGKSYSVYQSQETERKKTIILLKEVYSKVILWISILMSVAINVRSCTKHNIMTKEAQVAEDNSACLGEHI